MHDMQNIFERACLLQLQTRMWQGLKTVAPAIMARLGDADWIKGRKHLVDPEHLAGVKRVVSQARALLRKQALPFPVDGLTLVPRESISGIEAGLRELQQQFHLEVERFATDYAHCRSEARQVLGELFSETDYPMEIRQRFGFQWRYVQLTLPGQSSVLSPELYERERRKFLELMESTRTEAMLALREEFSGLVAHMAERLAPGSGSGEKPRVLRASMVEKLEAFLDGFSQRNLFQDQALEELVAQARQVLRGVDIEALRQSDAVKQRVQSGMQALREAVDDSLEELPRRRILMAA